MFIYRNSIICKAIAIVITVLLLANDVAFGIELKDSAAASALAPSSRFNPIVSVKWDGAHEKYIITENDAEKKMLIETASFKDDVAFLYLNLLIGQFLKHLDDLSKAGMSKRGRDNHLTKFKESIDSHFPDAVERFDRFRFKDMRWDGSTLCLPYERKDDRKIIQILRYYLPDTQTGRTRDDGRGTMDEKIMPSIDKLHRLEIPIGIGDVKVMLEDPKEKEQKGHAQQVGNPSAEHVVIPNDTRKTRKLFIEMLHLLNKNWWLIQDPGAGFRDKEALGIDPVNNIVNEAAIFGWTDYEFWGEENEESKIKIAERIINSRITMGKLKHMPRDDQERLLELTVSLGIQVDTSQQRHIRHLGQEEVRKASFDDISLAVSKIDITPEEARVRLEQNQGDTEEYLTAYPFTVNKPGRRFTSYTKEDKKNILRVLLPLLAELVNMPMDNSNFSWDYSFRLMVEAQSRLGLYDLAQKTIQDTLTDSEHLLRLSSYDYETRKNITRRFRSETALELADAKLKAGDFEGAYKLLHPTDIHYSSDRMSDLSEKAIRVMMQGGFIKDCVKYLRNESGRYWGSKRRCDMAENLARIGLFDAAFAIMATDLQPEHEFVAKAEIGMQLARAGDIERARLILAELVKKDEYRFHKRPDTLMEIARLQQAIGEDKEKILQTLTLCEHETEKLAGIRGPARLRYGVKLANLYFAVAPHKAQETLREEKERFFILAHRYQSDRADRFKNEFIQLFDAALKFGLYDEAQDMLNSYRAFREGTIQKYPLTGATRQDFISGTEYRLWQNMINARNGNRKPPMSIFEEIYYDFHGWSSFNFVDFSDLHEPLSASKLVNAILKEGNASSGERNRNRLDNAFWYVLMHLKDSNPDETRVLLKEMIGEMVEGGSAEDAEFAKSIMAFLVSDFGRALYYEGAEDEEEAERFTTKFLPALLKPFVSNMGLSSIDFRDGGDAKANYQDFMRLVLNFTAPRIHERPQGMPVKERISRSDIVVIAASGTNLVIDGRNISLTNPASLIGRTLEYRLDGKAVMLKFLKKDEDPANLAYEHDMMNFLYDRKKEWNLLGLFPRGILRTGKIRSELFSGHLPISIAGKGTPVELDVNVDGYVTFMAYEVPLDKNGRNPYAIYLNDPAIEPDDFKKAFRINVHDRFVMARHGLFDMEIIELFHNQQTERGRRYDWMVDVRHHQEHRHGAGRLNNVTAATLYPNIRLSGPADLAGLAFIRDMIENTEITALADNRFRRLLNMFGRDKYKAHNYIASALLGDTLLSLALIPPTYLERRNGLGYSAESKGKAAVLRENLKILFEESYKAYNGSLPPYDMLGVDFNIQLMACQMAYFMTDEYAADYTSIFKRPIPQDLFPGTTINQIAHGRGWHRERGWDVSNGVSYEIPTVGKDKIQRASRDLGPVNGPSPLQALIRALYISTSLMTLNWKGDGSENSGTDIDFSSPRQPDKSKQDRNGMRPLMPPEGASEPPRGPVGDSGGYLNTLIHEAEVALARGDYETALAKAEEALGLFRKYDELRDDEEKLQVFLDDLDPSHAENSDFSDKWRSKAEEIRDAVEAKGVSRSGTSQTQSEKSPPTGTKQSKQRFEPSVKGKRQTGVSKWDLLAQFRQGLQGLPEDVIGKLRWEAALGKKRKILAESGLRVVETIDGKFLAQELDRFLRQRAPISPLAAPLKSRLLRHLGAGRHLIAYSADDFDFVIKMSKDPNNLDWISYSWVGIGYELARERLGGLAVPTMIIDATDGSRRPFSYILESRGTQKTNLAIVQRKVIPVFDHLKYLGKSGRIAEAKALIDKYKAFVVSMFRRGVIDLDFTYPYGNYGIDLDSGKIYVFDFGDLIGAEEDVGTFLERLRVTNKYFYDDLKLQVDKKIADYFWQSPFYEEDFLTDQGESAFGADLKPEAADDFKMSFPYNEDQIRAMFMSHKGLADISTLGRISPETAQQPPPGTDSMFGKESGVLSDEFRRRAIREIMTQHPESAASPRKLLEAIKANRPDMLDIPRSDEEWLEYLAEVLNEVMGVGAERGEDGKDRGREGEDKRKEATASQHGEKTEPSPLTLESFMEGIKGIIEHEGSRPEPTDDVFDCQLLAEVVLRDLAASPLHEKIAAELQTMTEKYLEDEGYKKIRPHIYLAFRDFAREKAYRKEHMLFEDDEKRLPWSKAEKEAEPGIRKIVIALNKSPFLYTSSWSHSCLPSDHQRSDVGEYLGLSSPNWITRVSDGTQAFGIKRMRTYIGYGKVGGFISLRVDEGSPSYQEFVRSLNRIDGVRIINSLRRSYGPEKLIFVEVPKNLLQSDKELAVENYLKDKWAKVLKIVTAITKSASSTDTPLPDTAFFIGKWMPISKIEFIERDGCIRFMAYDITDPTRKEIEIRINSKRAPPGTFENYHNVKWTKTLPSKINDALAETLARIGENDRFLLEPNQYGIDGIGAPNLLAKVEPLKDNAMSSFHELFHASSLTVDDLTPYIEGGETTINAYINKEDKEYRQTPGMREHYALRLLQKQECPEEDKELHALIMKIEKDFVAQTKGMSRSYTSPSEERAGLISGTSSTILLNEETLQRILPKDALYEVVVRVLERRRGLIARMRLSNSRAGREIAEEIVQASKNKAAMLAVELKEEVQAIAAKKSPDSLSDLDQILMHAYNHLRHFSRRAFGAKIAGFLIGQELTGLEETGGLALKALSIFIPGPRAAPDFTNPLSEAHWRGGEYAKAMSCEAWYRGSGAAYDAQYERYPLLRGIIRTEIDTDMSTEAQLVTDRRRSGYTEYGSQKALEEFGWSMPQEIFEQMVEAHRVSTFRLIEVIRTHWNAASTAAWGMRESALAMYDAGRREEAKAIIDKIAQFRQDLIKAGRSDLAMEFSPESLQYKAVMDGREELFESREGMDSGKEQLEDSMRYEEFMKDLALSQWETDGGAVVKSWTDADIPMVGTDETYGKESGGVGEEFKRRAIREIISQNPGCAESPEKLLAAIRAKRPDILDVPQSDEEWLEYLAEVLNEVMGVGAERGEEGKDRGREGDDAEIEGKDKGREEEDKGREWEDRGREGEDKRKEAMASRHGEKIEPSPSTPPATIISEYIDSVKGILPEANGLYDALIPFYRFHLNNLGEPDEETRVMNNTKEQERELLEFWAEHFKIDDYGGYVTLGRRQAELYAMFVARGRFPKNAVFYLSDQVDDLLHCALQVLGVGENRIRVIKSSPDGQIDYADLKEKVEQNKFFPAVIGLNAGRFLGAVDDLKRVNKILNDAGVRHRHVHYSMSPLTIGESFTNGDFEIGFGHGVDSMTLPIDLFAGLPIPGTIILTKKEHALDISKGQGRVEYVDIKDTTIPGSRSGHAPLYLWLAMKTMGEEGFGAIAERAKAVCRYINKTLSDKGYPCRFSGRGDTIIFKQPSYESRVKWRLLSYERESCFEQIPYLTNKEIAEFVNDLLRDNFASSTGLPQPAFISPDEVAVQDAAAHSPSREALSALGEFEKRMERLSKGHLGFPANVKSDEEAYRSLSGLFRYVFKKEAAEKFGNEALRFFAKLYGLEDKDVYSGITAGGTWGNMIGILAGRERFPDGILYYSEDSHYSIDKVARVLGMEVRKVASQQNGEIDYNKLEAAINANRGRPVILNLNIGTTMKGAIDNPQKISAILKRNNIHDYHVHCDAALSGMLLPFMDGAPKIDLKKDVHSIAISAHKFAGLPMPSGVFMVRRDRAGRQLEKMADDVLSAQTGHVLFYLWYAVTQNGLDGFRREALTCVENARYLHQRLREIGRPSILNKFSNTVIFARPSERLIDKWALAPNGDFAHIVVMQSVTREKIDAFMDDLKEEDAGSGPEGRGPAAKPDEPAEDAGTAQRGPSPDALDTAAADEKGVPAGNAPEAANMAAELPAARRLLSLLGIESPEKISGAASIERREEDGLTIIRIEIPDYAEGTPLPQGGLALLRLILLEDSEVKRGDLTADFLYDKTGRLIAIFPVKIEGGRESFLRMRYLNLSPYYFSLPRIYDPESLAKWDGLISQLRHDKALIDYYKSRNYSSARFMKDSGTSQYALISFSRSDGSWAAEPILRVGEDGVELSRENIPLKKDPKTEKAVIAVLPTVYNPAFKHEQDESFYGFVIQEAGYGSRTAKARRPLIEKGSVCLDYGAGSGAMTWLLSILTGRKVYAIEKNPVAALNLRYNARQIGFPVEVICADSIVAPDGERWFAETIDLIISNGPGFIPEEVDEEFLPSGLSGLWDNDYGGKMFLRPLVNALPKAAKSAILWNESRLEERDGILHDRIVEVIMDASPKGYRMKVYPALLVYDNAAYVITPEEVEDTPYVPGGDSGHLNVRCAVDNRVIDRERGAAIDLRDAIIEHGMKIKEAIAGEKKEEKMSEERLIVALGTRWIPGYAEVSGSPYYKDLNGLIVSIRKFCEKRGIPFVDRDDGELLNEITALRSQAEYENAKIVVLAGEETLNKELASLQNDNNAFLFGVNNANLVNDSHIHLVEMLQIAVRCALADAPPQNDPRLPIERRGGFWVFIPHADLVLDGYTLRRLYEVQRFA